MKNRFIGLLTLRRLRYWIRGWIWQWVAGVADERAARATLELKAQVEALRALLTDQTLAADLPVGEHSDGVIVVTARVGNRDMMRMIPLRGLCMREWREIIARLQEWYGVPDRRTFHDGPPGVRDFFLEGRVSRTRP